MESILNLLTETEDDLLTCPICLTSFNCPKILACLHTFCLSCLIKHQVAPGLMTKERMLATVAEQERRTWRRIQEQLPDYAAPLAESYAEPEETRREESAVYHLHRQVDNEGQQRQQQQQQLQQRQGQQLQQQEQPQQQQLQQQQRPEQRIQQQQQQQQQGYRYQQQQQQQHQQHQHQQQQQQQQQQQGQQHHQQQQKQQQQQQQQFICCPICRELTALPANGLFGLRNDFRLESFSKCLHAIRSQCTLSHELSQVCHEGHHIINTSRNPSAANTPLLDHSTSSTSDQRHQTNISRQDRICEVDQRSRARSRAQSVKVKTGRWKSIIRSFKKCLSSSCVFDEDFTEVLQFK